MNPLETPYMRTLARLDRQLPTLHNLWVWLWQRELTRVIITLQQLEQRYQGFDAISHLSE